MHKVELSYNSPTPRMRYGAKLIFEFCLGVEHKWVSSDNGDFVVISYEDNSITTPLHAISFSQDDQALSSGVKFPCKVLGNCDLDLDPFASAVFMAACWNEIYREDQLKKDEHNRFVGVECSQPVVELLALDIAHRLGIPKDLSRYSYQPTIDIDVAYAFKGRGTLRTIFASLKDFLSLRWSRLVLRLKVLSGKEVDPYDTYSWLKTLHDSKGLSSKAFVLCAKYKKPYDVGLSRKVIEKLSKQLSNWDFNWHPSYSALHSLSIGNTDDFLLEKENFPRESSEVRAHFLRCDARHWANLDELNLKADYSLGYADIAGFKSGMCRPYPAFNLKTDKELSLLLHPVIVMDSTLKSYLGLTPEKAIELVSKLNNEVRNVGGQMITIFHNSSVSDFEEWDGWRQAYKEIVNLCSRPNN